MSGAQPRGRLRQLIDAHRDEIRDVARRNGALEIRLIGSVARGMEGDHSDVDFLVSFERGRSLFDLGNLSLELEQLLGVHVDVLSEGGLSERDAESFLEGAAII